MTFDGKAANIQYWYEICELFQNPELTNPIVPNYSRDEEKGKLIINPANYPIGQVNISGLDTEQVNRYEHGSNVFFPHDTGTDWGNMGTMYLVVYRDLETGEILEKTLVHIITV